MHDAATRCWRRGGGAFGRRRPDKLHAGLTVAAAEDTGSEVGRQRVFERPRVGTQTGQWVGSGQVRSGRVRSGQVRSGSVHLHRRAGVQASEQVHM